jgi:hypothetical protein
MDNSNSLSNSIIQQSTDPSITASTIADTTSGNSNSFFDYLKNISATTWLLIILILAFLGFNIFVYLAKGTQGITNVFEPIFQKIFGTTAAVSGETIDVAAEGAKSVVSTTSGAVTTGLSAVQNVTPNVPNSNIKTEPIQQTTQKPDSSANNSLNKALNTSQQQTQQTTEYEPHEASSSVSKSGWCYIGEDRGYRTCAEVGVNDQCMSGDIFPTQEICINPNLRA